MFYYIPLVILTCTVYNATIFYAIFYSKLYIKLLYNIGNKTIPIIILNFLVVLSMFTTGCRYQTNAMKLVHTDK